LQSGPNARIIMLNVKPEAKATKNGVCILLLLAAIPCRARTITIDDDGPADFNNIQAAIDDANDGDTVEIQPGTYTGDGNRDIDFFGKAITVTGADPNDPNIVAQTIIDCNAAQDNEHRGFSFNSGEGRDAVLQGLTITNGYILGHGGAIVCDFGSSPTIRSCIIVGNTAERVEKALYSMGGGIYCGDESSPLIENCTIANNTVSGNESWDGAGGGIGCERSNAVILKCTITGNSATGRGGGISFGEYSVPIIEDCIISDNSTTDAGGGVACSNGSWEDPVIVSRCIITGNTATNGGGIRCDGDYTRFNDCLIAGNTATENGGGISMWAAYPTFTNCTIAGNSAASGGGVYHCLGVLRLYNCILWGNSAPEGSQLSMRTCHSELAAYLVAEYSNIQGGRAEAYLSDCGEWAVEMELGCIDVDPGFIDPGNMDFSLRPDSWCIDKGSNDYANDTDILGNPRIVDGDIDANAVVDMGAYESAANEGPMIQFSALEITIVADQNDPNPPPQRASIHSRGPDELHWTLSADCPWLSFVPSEGIATMQSEEITFTADVNGLPPGTYNCNLTITAPPAINSPKTLPVELRLLGNQVRVPSQFPTIQDGIDHASEGGSVIVADGLYTGTGNRNIDFKGKAITVRNENGPAACIIDCQGSHEHFRRGFHFRNGENETSIVDGFTVINASGTSGAVAVLCENSGPTIKNCRIIDNPGGGIYCKSQSSPIITNCVLDGNGYTEVVCVENSSPTIANCVISSRGYTGYCSIYCSESRPTITNCTIVANYDYAIQCVHDAHAVMKNCIIWGNVIRVDGESEAEITYSNVQGGWPGVGNTSGDPCFAASGHWQDKRQTPDEAWDDVSVGVDYYLKSQGGRWDPNTATWVIDATTSPCIDAGDPASPIGREPFPNGGIINMGAYGGTAEASKSYFGGPMCETIMAGDVNGDCEINFEDFRLMALHWMEENN